MLSTSLSLSISSLTSKSLSSLLLFLIAEAATMTLYKSISTYQTSLKEVSLDAAEDKFCYLGDMNASDGAESSPILKMNCDWSETN